MYKWIKNFLNNFTRLTFKVAKTFYYSCLGFPNFLDNNLFTAIIVCSDGSKVSLLSGLLIASTPLLGVGCKLLTSWLTENSLFNSHNAVTRLLLSLLIIFASAFKFSYFVSISDSLLLRS